MARRAVKDQATAYARAVVAGKIVAGKPIILACKRHLRDLKAARVLGLTWRRASGQQAIEFFRDVLVLEDGRPFVLEDYQAFIVGSLFGWYAGDYRRFRDAYVEMGKGSGKSPLAAGIGLYGLIADGEPAAEVYSAATTQDQARIVWKDADRMVSQSEELKDCIKQEAACLTYTSGQGVESVFRPVSSEHRGLDGKRVHIGLIDELHEHPNALVVDKIRAGTKRRRNALVFRITNSGYDRHSVCWNEHEYSLKVLEGTIDNESWFAFVCALDDGDSWQDEDVWPKTNPGLAVGLPPVSYLREQVASAVGMPSKENIVRRLNFCEWTEQSVRAIPMDEWDKKSAAAPIDVAALKGRRCYGGLDLARVADLSAFDLIFPPLADEPWIVLCWFWVPEDDIQRRALKDRVPYDVWAREGYIKPTPGNTTDFGFIEAKVLELAGLYEIVEVGFDRTFAGEIVQALMSEGVRMVEVGQGFLSMAAPTAEMLRLVKAGELQHGGNPVLRWNASNLAVATDAAGNMKPDKERSVEKIDGLVALCNALSRVGKAGPVETPSIYRTRGLITSASLAREHAEAEARRKAEAAGVAP